MIMWEMLTGQLPWYGCNNMGIIYNVVFKHERPDLPGMFAAPPVCLRSSALSCCHEKDRV